MAVNVGVLLGVGDMDGVADMRVRVGSGEGVTVGVRVGVKVGGNRRVGVSNISAG